MPDIVNTDIINKAVIAAVTTIVPIVIAGLFKVGKLVTDYAELRGKLDAMSAHALVLDDAKHSHNTRLQLLEKAIVAIEGLTPAIKAMAVTNSRLEALQEATNRRLELLENRER